MKRNDDFDNDPIGDDEEEDDLATERTVESGGAERSRGESAGGEAGTEYGYGNPDDDDLDDERGDGRVIEQNPSTDQ